MRNYKYYAYKFCIQTNFNRASDALHRALGNLFECDTSAARSDVTMYAYVYAQTHTKTFNPEWRVTILKYRLANVCDVCTLSTIQGLHLKGTTCADHVQVGSLRVILIILLNPLIK